MYRILPLTDPELLHLPVGGKVRGLALLLQAGLPVPPGFCVIGVGTEAAQRAPLPGAGVVAEVLEAWRGSGGGTVAVRSSALHEDGEAASYAGQQLSVLGVRDETMLLAAIDRCWAAARAERPLSYARAQGEADTPAAMTVLIQQQVEADIAGVLFTCHPLDVADKRMMVEASWGLGDLVVSGRITPDRFLVDPNSGSVVESQLATKAVQASAHGLCAVEPERQQIPCLDPEQLARLHELAQKVVALSGPARDLEFAWANGICWLLQDRPVTSKGNQERERVRQEEIERLRRQVPSGGTAWSRCGWTESLPTPTPMTWDLYQRLLGVRGALGGMYRDLGFEPDPALENDGVYQLIAGRLYCDLRREPRLQFRWLPFEHDLELLARHPERAGRTTPQLNPRAADWHFWLLLPWHFWRLLRSSVQLRTLLATFATDFRDRVLPSFLAEARAELAQPLEPLSVPELVTHLDAWATRTLTVFARDSMKPAILATVALGSLERGLRRHLSAARTQNLCAQLLAGLGSDRDTNVTAALADLSAGRLSREQFRNDFGHRGPEEMELAAPRWHEIDDLPLGLQVAAVPTTHQDPTAHWQQLAETARIPPAASRSLASDVQHLATYVRQREEARHWLMLGTLGLRRILLELGQRLGLGDAVFFLTFEELRTAASRTNMAELAAQRRRQRRLLLGLEAPAVIFSRDLEILGRPTTTTARTSWQGTPLAPGSTEGRALVLEKPESVQLVGSDWILVCPATDPGWVPLLGNIRGLVIEQGGILSHGAIVARELHLPAVGGLPGITRQVQMGQRLRIDGATGRVELETDTNLSGPV